MTPSFIAATYKQYTRDSGAVAAWLAKTAVIHGYPKDLCITQAPMEQKAKPKGGRLKGKARKLAQQESSKNPSDSQNGGLKPNLVPERSKYLVSIDDLISLAEWIVKSNETCIEVPGRIFSMLDRAILSRRIHYDWWYYKSKKDGGDSAQEGQANKSPGYFLGVLEKVREILKLRMSPELLQDPLGKPVEGASTLKSEPGTAGQKPNSTPQVEYRLNRVLDLAEVHFAFHCLLCDFKGIRLYLQQVWYGYKLGKLDLVAASVTTNTAINVARDLQEDFTETFPEHSDFEKHLNQLYVLSCINFNHDPGFRVCPDDEMNFEAYEEVEAKFFPAYTILSFLNKQIKPGRLPLYAGQYGSYEPKSHRESKSPKEKFREDKAILLAALPDFCVVAHAPGGMPAEDEMTRGIREMVKDDKVPGWLVLAAQVYLDIHHILRQKVSYGFHYLVKSARYVEKNIQQILVFHQNLRIDNWLKWNDELLFRTLDVIKIWVNLDAVQEARTKVAERFNMYETSAESFLFLQNHPWYCGLLSYCIKVAAREASIMFANACSSILSSAHLYHGLCEAKLIANPWPDMDLVLLMHQSDDLFMGDFPKTAADGFQRFSLVMGRSANKAAKSKKLNELSLVCKMLKNPLGRGNGKICANLSRDDVNTILDVQDLIEAWKPPRYPVNLDIPLAPATDENHQSINFEHRPNPTRVSASVAIPPMRLLNALFYAVQSETLELTFDYFSMHIFCWKMLHDLQQALHYDLVKLYGEGYLDLENQFPRVVGYILRASVSGTDSPELAGPYALLPKKRDRITDYLLVKAAQVVNRLLATSNGQSAGQSRIDAMGQFGIALRIRDEIDVGEGMGG